MSGTICGRAVLAVLLFGAVGCTSAAERSVTASPSPAESPSKGADAVWEGPGEPNEAGALDVERFNAFLETADPSWATSPLRTSIEFVGLRDPESLRTTVEVEAFPPEGADRVVVTITEDGLADDSVAGIRYVLHLERMPEGGWRLREATRSERCQEGRGPAGFVRGQAGCI